MVKGEKVLKQGDKIRNERTGMVAVVDQVHGDKVKLRRTNGDVINELWPVAILMDCGWKVAEVVDDKPLPSKHLFDVWDYWLSFLERTNPPRSQEDDLFAAWNDGWLKGYANASQ